MWILVEKHELFGNISIYDADGKKEQLKKIERKHCFDIWHTVVTLERKIKKEKDTVYKIVDTRDILAMLTALRTNELVNKIVEPQVKQTAN